MVQHGPGDESGVHLSMQIALIHQGIRDILGPGNRLAVFTAGCPRRCPGCETPELQEESPAFETDPAIALGRIDLGRFDGVTISGGDPFIHPEDLLYLVRCLAPHFDDIFVYTGYLYEELRDYICDQIFSRIAVLCDGPYIASLDRGERLRGSINQRFIFFKEKYREAYLSLNKRPRDPVDFKEGYSIGLRRN